MAIWTEAKTHPKRQNYLRVSLYSMCVQFWVWGVYHRLLQWLKNVCDVCDGKTDRCSGAQCSGAQGCWLKVPLFIKQAHRTEWTLTNTHQYRNMCQWYHSAVSYSQQSSIYNGLLSWLFIRASSGFPASLSSLFSLIVIILSLSLCWFCPSLHPWL